MHLAGVVRHSSGFGLLEALSEPEVLFTQEQLLVPTFCPPSHENNPCTVNQPFLPSFPGLFLHPSLKNYVQQHTLDNYHVNAFLSLEILCIQTSMF